MNAVMHMGGRMLVAFLALTMSAAMVPAIAFADDGVKAAAADFKVDAPPGVKVPVSADVPSGAIAANGAHAPAGTGADSKGDTPPGPVAVMANDVNECVQVSADGAEKSVEVGNVTVEGGQPGIIADAINGGKATAKAGDVRVAGDGVVVRPSGQGAVTVEVGSVQAAGDGVQVIADGGGIANLKAGDIAAGRTGLFAYIGEGSAVNALVAGTLSGKSAPISFFGSSSANAGRFTLTAWKIDAGDGNIFLVANPADGGIELQAVMSSAPLTDAEAAAKAIEQGDFTLTAAEGGSALEKSILYIMRLGTAEGATLSATYADGKPLATSYDYSVAKEGERVMLKVDLEEGCELTAAYDGSGNKVELVKGEDGGYYIAYTVPKGGGLGLSVEVSTPLASKAANEVASALAHALATTDAAARGISANVIGADGASTIPRTGDDSAHLLLAAIALLAAVALVGSKIRGRE